MTYSRYWINSYPPGVPADIDPLQIRSVAHLAEESFMRFADRVAFVQMGRNITYRKLDAQTRAFGAWLQQHTGLKRGGRVAIMMPNLLQYPIALFGVLRAGGTVVNTNPLYTARELEHQLKDSGAETVVILENFAHVLQEVIGRTQVKHVVVTSVGELLGFPKGAIVDFVVRTVRKQVPAWSLPGHHRFLDVLAAGARHALQQIDLGHDDLAFLQYTGGTTGVSKGAMLSHGNIVANTLQSTAWTEPAWPRDTHGTAITALPLYHIFALTGNCIVFLRLGWTNVLITNPRDFPAFVKELKKHRFTFISGVNTLFNALLHTPGFETVDFSALRCTLGGGMSVQRAVAERDLLGPREVRARVDAILAHGEWLGHREPKRQRVRRTDGHAVHALHAARIDDLLVLRHLFVDAHVARAHRSAVAAAIACVADLDAHRREPIGDREERAIGAAVRAETLGSHPPHDEEAEHDELQRRHDRAWETLPQFARREGRLDRRSRHAVPPAQQRPFEEHVECDEKWREHEQAAADRARL